MNIYTEVSHTSRTGARTGIQTVVRGLVQGLKSQNRGMHPLRWSFKLGCLTPLKPKWEANLGMTPESGMILPAASLLRSDCWEVWRRTLGLNYRAPVHLHPAHKGELAGRWLILPELMEGRHVRLATAYAKEHGMRVGGIFHDAIAWLHPEMVLHWRREQHADYMRAFAELEVVMPVSNQSARDYSGFLQSQGVQPPRIRTCGLAAEIIGRPRETKLKETAGGPVKILCVSTLEPRKNHAMLIKAFEQACAQLRGGVVELHIVGGKYPSAPEIAEMVRAATVRNPAIFWHESAGPEELRNFYTDCDFSVFASWIEGFGLPVVESLWFGRPCLCSNEGVMAENAVEGGCLTANMRDVNALADGIVKLAGQPEFRRELAGQVLRRKLKTWDDYAGEVLEVLEEIGPMGPI